MCNVGCPKSFIHTSEWVLGINSLICCIEDVWLAGIQFAFYSPDDPIATISAHYTFQRPDLE